MNETQLDDEAFALFAEVYPHEAYDSEPERFLAFAKKSCPQRTREDIVSLLEKTRSRRGGGERC